MVLPSFTGWSVCLSWYFGLWAWNILKVQELADEESHRLWRFIIHRLHLILNPRSMSFPASQVMPHVLCTGTSLRIIPWMIAVRTIILQLDNQVFNSQKGHLDFLFWNHIQNITEDPPFPSLQKWELQLKFSTYIIPSCLNIEVQWYVHPGCILVTEQHDVVIMLYT